MVRHGAGGRPGRGVAGLGVRCARRGGVGRGRGKSLAGTRTAARARQDHAGRPRPRSPRISIPCPSAVTAPCDAYACRSVMPRRARAHTPYQDGPRLPASACMRVSKESSTQTQTQTSQPGRPGNRAHGAGAG